MTGRFGTRRLFSWNDAAILRAWSGRRTNYTITTLRSNQMQINAAMV